MAETRTAPRLDGVRAEIREPLRLLAERLEAALGDNLKSVSVVGSALTQDFEPKISDVNTVVLLETHDIPALNAVALLAPRMSRHRISPPLLLTPFYIQRSCDVFGVEFLDFQLVHETILGDDPFAPLQFQKQDVRLQCERELKAMLVRLRQGYLASAGNKQMVRDILISTAKGLAPAAAGDAVAGGRGPAENDGLDLPARRPASSRSIWARPWPSITGATKGRN